MKKFEEPTFGSQNIEEAILLIRGQKVLLDSQLSVLFGVETKRLVEAVKRNLERFPPDFMFQLSIQEVTNLRSQFATSSLQDAEITKETSSANYSNLRRYGGRRYNPYAFTEQGIAMLSSVLNSPTAIQVNIAIVRAFVRLRQLISDNKELMTKLNALEQKYDQQFKVVFDAMRKLMEPSSDTSKKIPIGFGR